MRRRDFIAASGIGLAAACRAGAAGSLPSTVPAGPRPSPAQLAWQRRELALFLHFGVNTFTDREWGDGREDPHVFAPAALDARQWTRAARAGGFHTVILTAKHHDGFCLWPSRLTPHSVAASPWRAGAGDVVRELADAARADGLGLGLYLSPWDRHEPSYGDSPRYNDFYCAQLTELLTGYGPITEVWFDGANGEGPNGRRQVYDWARIHQVVRQHQPAALIFSDAGPDLRWAGNERGVAGDPNWCTVNPATVPVPGLGGDDVIASLQHGDPDGSVWRPAECDVSIRPGWFWHPAEDDAVRTVDNMLELYLASAGRNSGLLLNVPPTTAGQLHPTDIARIAGFGARRDAIFGHDLARRARVTASGSAPGSRPSSVLDPDPDTRWSAAVGAADCWLQLDFAAPVAFDLISLQEAIAEGQSISSFAIDQWSGGWTRIAEGTTVGHRRIERIAPVSTTRLRVSLVSRRGAPRLSRLSLHHT